jgi:cell division protein FtsZ
MHRTKVASEGIIRLEERSDSVIVIPNERLLSMCDANVLIEDAFKMVDSVLFRSVEGISEVITSTGNINLDFNDVKATMSDAGHAWISMGYGSGDNRAVEAARDALASPLFDFSIDKAQRILFNIMCGDLTLTEVNEAANVIREVADPTAQIIFGLATDPRIGSGVKLTLIATGFGERKYENDNEPPVEPEEYVPEFGWEQEGRSFLPWTKPKKGHFP